MSAAAALASTHTHTHRIALEPPPAHTHPAAILLSQPGGILGGSCWAMLSSPRSATSGGPASDPDHLDVLLPMETMEIELASKGNRYKCCGGKRNCTRCGWCCWGAAYAAQALIR